MKETSSSHLNDLNRRFKHNPLLRKAHLRKTKLSPANIRKVNVFEGSTPNPIREPEQNLVEKVRKQGNKAIPKGQYETQPSMMKYTKVGGSY